MSGIPVGRFYPTCIKKSPAVASLERQFDCGSAEQDGLDQDFRKGRSLSTSTPLLHRHKEQHVPSRSLSTSAFQDSGYADSLSSSANSVSYIDSFANVTGIHAYSYNADKSPHTNDSPHMFATPSYAEESLYSIRGRQLEFTPVSPGPYRDNRKLLHTVSWGQSCVRYGDSKVEYTIPEEELGGTSPVKQTSIWTPQHRLQFDSDDEEFDQDMSLDDSFNEMSRYGSHSRDGDRSIDLSLCTSTSTAPLGHTSDLEDRFEEVLQMFTPTAPDRLIGRKMGIPHVDILSELHYRNISSVLTNILGFLTPSDLCRYKFYS